MLLCVVFAAIVTQGMAFGGNTVKMGASDPSKSDRSKFDRSKFDRSKFDSSKFELPVYDPSQKPSGRPGLEVPVDIAPLGVIEVQVLGPSGGPLAIAQHGANPAWTALTEFDMVASELAEQGYRVLLPNLHSNPKAAPGVFGISISDADFQKVLVDLVELEGNASGELPLLLGKSWGGGAVARFAANNPNMVQKLVLVAPGAPKVEAQGAQALSMPLQVFWAKDDPITPFSDAAVFQEHAPRVVVHVVDTGGHNVLPEYTDPILAFAASPRP